MRTQTIDELDIQRELLEKQRKRKPVAIWLTAFLLMAIIGYAAYVVCYMSGVDLKTDGLSFAVPPLAIIVFIVFLSQYYYIDLYKIKAKRFEVTEDHLYQKAIELVSRYHRIEKENVLYFGCGKISVSKEVYSYANVGDSFYIVLLNAKKSPALVYHTKHFKIEKSQAENDQKPSTR